MKLYNFSVYAERRKERLAAAAVAEVVGSLENPGSVIILKACVSDWFVLHRTVLKQANSS